jgi:hypothetical protein
MTSSASRHDEARHAIAIATVVSSVMLSALITLPASAQTRPQQRYAVSIGSPSGKLNSGTVWLYSYSWYGLQQFKLAAIQNGVAVVPLDADRLKREADPHPDTSGYVLVIQAGEHLWYRTPDIDPDRFWLDLRGAMRLLGKATDLATGETQLVLPALSRRQITLLQPDGSPRTNTDLAVSIFLWNQNHCGVHEGLPLGTFRTNEKGTIEVLAPLVPLYLDGLEYYAEAGTGPAGTAYSANSGMKLGPEEIIVRKEHWQLPGFTAELQLLTRAGRPRPDVNVYLNWNTDSCGGADTIGQTDARGIARFYLNATFTGVTLMVGGPYSPGDPEGEKNTRELTAAELKELFAKHKLTIRW